MGTCRGSGDRPVVRTVRGPEDGSVLRTVYGPEDGSVLRTVCGPENGVRCQDGGAASGQMCAQNVMTYESRPHTCAFHVIPHARGTLQMDGRSDRTDGQILHALARALANAARSLTRSLTRSARSRTPLARVLLLTSPHHLLASPRPVLVGRRPVRRADAHHVSTGASASRAESERMSERRASARASARASTRACEHGKAHRATAPRASAWRTERSVHTARVRLQAGAGRSEWVRLHGAPQLSPFRPTSRSSGRLSRP